MEKLDRPDKKRDFSGLPAGWKREEVIRKHGLSAGKSDVYYHGPNGERARSKPELCRILGKSFDLSCFDYRTGKIMQSALRKSKDPKSSKYDHARGMRHDANLVLPIRQTASIFKQPVTVIRTRPESSTRSDLKQGSQDPPRQLFWEKRLNGLNACDIQECIYNPMDLPKNIQGAGPDLSTENMLQSIAAALHLSSLPVTGQTAPKASILKNPAVNVSVDQPLIQAISVSEDDLLRQERRMIDARLRLQQAMTM